MEPLPRGPGPSAWPLTCLLLLLPLRCPGAGAQQDQPFRLWQPQENVTLTAGETLSLTCTVSSIGPAGPVKWLKGWGSGNETVYEDVGSFPRVTRVANASDKDFSIRIGNVQPEDAGTYYCAKFRRSVTGLQVFQRGNDTVVSVHARPTRPVVSGPGHRARPGQSVPFTCTAGGFFPRDISVKWLKNGHPVSAQPPQITPGRTNSSFSMSSVATVTLHRDDVGSRLVCEVQHRTLREPQRGTYQLREALRVPPSVRVVADSLSPAEVNRTVNFTCYVEDFYPGDLSVTWLESGTELKVENVSRPVETPGGLFRLSSLVEVQATLERNGSTFTCRVLHDGQTLVSGTATLHVTFPPRKEPSDQSQPQNGVNLASSLILVSILLQKGLLGALLLVLFKYRRS